MSGLDLIAPTSQLLNQSADEVTLEELNSDYIQDIIDRMQQLAAGKGHSKQDSRQMVGLAAVQIGVPKRIVLIDVTSDGSNKKQSLQVVINPRITKLSKEILQGREGCWSCGNICGIVERAKELILEGLDRDGKPLKLELTDFVARIAQHEVDHLNGVRFPERIPADQPERLHWVEPTEFESYRKNWMHWPKLCPRDQWEELRKGVAVKK